MCRNAQVALPSSLLFTGRPEPIYARQRAFGHGGHSAPSAPTDDDVDDEDDDDDDDDDGIDAGDDDVDVEDTAGVDGIKLASLEHTVHPSFLLSALYALSYPFIPSHIDNDDDVAPMFKISVPPPAKYCQFSALFYIIRFVIYSFAPCSSFVT